MLVAAIADFFKYKIVSSIVVLACWSSHDQVQFSRKLFNKGVKASFLCNDVMVNKVSSNHFFGILVFESEYKLISNISQEWHSAWYKWLLVGDSVPTSLSTTRYDSDMTLLSGQLTNISGVMNGYLEDIFVQSGEVSKHPWAVWSEVLGLQVTHDRARILRRVNLRKTTVLKVAVPIGHYVHSSYNGTFSEYLADRSHIELDTTIRSSFGAASLIVEALNATMETLPLPYWALASVNNSVLSVVASGGAHIAGSILRMQKTRAEMLDYIMPFWPFSVGFTYLGERKSSSSMFLEPFTTKVWWCCLGAGVVLAVMLRITAQKQSEKDEAAYNVLATCLQQDANAVPDGISGRWTFTVLSISSMLIYAYYNSAIVSALMSAGTSGPTNFRELGDSKYAISSEDFDYMRHQFFDIVTENEDLEYLKKKKMKSNQFYNPVSTGVMLIRSGETAYHSDYNSIYPLLRKFTDSEICKLAYIDTIPLSLTWITAPKRSQYTDVMRSKSNWIHETGLRTREVSLWRSTPAPCQSSLLAERVKFADIFPLMGISIFFVFLSVLILGLEILIFKWSKFNSRRLRGRRGNLT